MSGRKERNKRGKRSPKRNSSSCLGGCLEEACQGGTADFAEPRGVDSMGSPNRNSSSYLGGLLARSRPASQACRKCRLGKGGYIYKREERSGENAINVLRSRGDICDIFPGHAASPDDIGRCFLGFFPAPTLLLGMHGKDGMHLWIDLPGSRCSCWILGFFFPRPAHRGQSIHDAGQLTSTLRCPQ